MPISDFDNLASIALAARIRTTSLKAISKAKAAHIGSALSIADIIAVLYEKILNIEPKHPDSTNRDRFILSKGHACIAVYAALADKKFFSLTELINTYACDHSKFMAHISHQVPGVEFSTGSLGHGLAFAAGKALAGKIRGHTWRVFTLLSDGELGEGSNWEAFMFAAHQELDNLFAIIDYNKLQSLTSVDKTLRLEPLNKKLEAFGWEVLEADGHNHKQLIDALSLKNVHKKPRVLIAHTTKGKGVSFMENKVEWHYKCPTESELKLALAEILNA